MMTLASLFWLIIIALAIWLIVRLAGRGGAPGGGPEGRHRAEEILRERYARGEVDRETYQRMLEDLRGGRDQP